MGLVSLILDQNQQLAYQLFTIPLGLLFYSLATKEYLTLLNRYISLTLGGCFLAVLTMGPYSMLLFIPAVVFVLLVHFLKPFHIHYWIFGLQMCWQTFWHLNIQYQQYWLQEPVDSRLLLAVSALMLLCQRVTSVSMDLQEGKVIRCFSRCYLSQVISLIPFLSYTLYFPALLGGPLCSFNTYVTFMKQMSISPPPFPLTILPLKIANVLLLLTLRYFLTNFLQSNIFKLSRSPYIVWIWAFSLVLRLKYYAHWKMSECINNAIGLGFNGHSPNGRALWDGLSDGNPWAIETSKRISEFARLWNGTTAAWLRRLVYKSCKGAPLIMTFIFSALWHGLHPGQVIGFLAWAIAVLGDYKLNKSLHPKLTSVWRRCLHTCLSWAYTQMVIAFVVVTIELQSFEAVRLFCTSYIVLFPLASVILLII